MPEFWMCLINNVRELSNILGWMQYIALHKTTEQLSRQTYSEQCQTIMMERLQKKKNAWVQVRIQTFFRTVEWRVCGTLALW